MQSDQSAVGLIGTTIMLATIAGATLPTASRASPIAVLVCGQGGPTRVPVRDRDSGDDGGCAIACHAADTRKRRTAR